ncbi:methyltransferase domain-containing protein [Pseudomonadota bacterium]
MMPQDYGRLLADSDRIHAFDRAIHKAVKPDDIVAELGCGVGTFGIFAARAGARRVFGVDSGPVIELARQVSEANQVGVEFIAGDARDVDLPEPATLLIFEDFSTGVLDGPVPGILNSARERWMAEQHRVIPQRITLNLAPIQAASAWREALPLEELGERPYGIDLKPLADIAPKSMSIIRSPKDAVLLAPSSVVLDHDLVESLPSRWSTNGVFELPGDGSFDGLCMWFDMVLDDTESYSNNPASSGVYGQVFFPAPARWPVNSGDRLGFKLRFDSTPFGGVWKWSFDLAGIDGKTRSRWSSNTFAASAITPQSLQRYRPEDVVHLSPRAEREAMILNLADGRRTLEAICSEVQKQCDIPDRETALTLVLRTIENRRVFK